MQKTPIIFIHYGDTPYLKYTLKSAKKTNPNKKIIILGDKFNEKYKKIGIEHFYFKDYDIFSETKQFDKVFQFIGGEKRGKTEEDIYFEYFCFKRWFYLYLFMKSQKINKCWYFDSDTLFLGSLTGQEYKFKQYDCTEQSNGSCMKGYINNINILKEFIDKINKLFQDQKYLETNTKDFTQHPTYSYCDMRAYNTYKKDTHFKHIPLNIILNNEIFDECICQEHDMEMAYDTYAKKQIKKLYFKDGNIYEKTKYKNNLVKLVTINMSWVPLSFIKRIYYYSTHSKFPPLYIILFDKIKKIPETLKFIITIRIPRCIKYKIIKKIKHLIKEILFKITPKKLVNIYCNNNFNFGSITYSQKGEDIILKRILGNKKNGFYVDVGAHHPTRFSNTNYFYQRDWKGLNIDAMPGSMELFNKQRPRDTNLEFAISNKKETLTYYKFNEPALNGFSKEISQQRHIEDNNYKIIDEIKIKTIPLKKVLDNYLPQSTDIDFLDIDVEGYDYKVLTSNDWNKYRPNIVLIEILGKTFKEIHESKITVFMKKQNYQLFAKTFESVFFKKNE